MKKLFPILGVLLVLVSCKNDDVEKTDSITEEISDPSLNLNYWTYTGFSKIDYSHQIRNDYVNTIKLHLNNVNLFDNKFDFIFSEEIYSNPWCTNCHDFISYRLTLNEDQSALSEWHLNLFQTYFKNSDLPVFHVNSLEQTGIWSFFNMNGYSQPGYRLEEINNETGAIETKTVGGEYIYEATNKVKTLDVDPSNAFLGHIISSSGTQYGGMIHPIYKGDGNYIHNSLNRYGTEKDGATMGGAVLDDGRMVFTTIYRDSLVILESIDALEKKVLGGIDFTVHPSKTKNKIHLSQIQSGASETNYKFSKWYKDGDFIVLFLVFETGSKYVQINYKTYEIEINAIEFPTFDQSNLKQVVIHPNLKNQVFLIEYNTEIGYSTRVEKVEKYTETTVTDTIVLPEFPEDPDKAFDQSILVEDEGYYLLTRFGTSIHFYFLQRL